MQNGDAKKALTLWNPATYRIVLQGSLDERLFEPAGAMQVVTSDSGDRGPVTTLVGRLRDQAELIGLLSWFYDLHLPILSVELLALA